MRGIIDRVAFNRAIAQWGRMSPALMRSGYIYHDSAVALKMCIPQLAPVPVAATIIFLTSPSVSLTRETAQQGSRVFVTSDFLGLLYEQYMRLYAELRTQQLTNKHVSTTDMPVPIVIALNMEEHPEICYRKFAEAMEQILFLTGRL